jgi:hypothetical protein
LIGSIVEDCVEVSAFAMPRSLVLLDPSSDDVAAFRLICYLVDWLDLVK